MPANGLNVKRCFPQGLKPTLIWAVYGTTEVVPFQNINDHLWGGHHLRECFFCGESPIPLPARLIGP
jgi:hypothetical protein